MLKCFCRSDTVQAAPQPRMFGLISAFVFSALAATSVKAHGYVQDVVVGSTHYTGYLPYSDPYYPTPPERIIRPIPGNGASTCIPAVDTLAHAIGRSRHRPKSD